MNCSDSVVDICYHTTEKLKTLKNNYNIYLGSSYLRGRVLRGVYGSDGPIKPSASASSKDQSVTKPEIELDEESLAPMKTSPEMSSNVTIIKMDKGKLTYVDIITKCAPVVKYCLLNAIGSEACVLSCLLDPLEVKHTTTIVARVAKTLCYPIGSIYDSGVPLLIEAEGKVKNVAGFLNALGIEKENYAQVSLAGAESLPMQLIKYGKSPILDVLKPIVATLSTSLSIAGNYFGDVNSQKNFACQKVDMSDPLKRIAEQFITNPFTTDVLLGGWFVLTNIGQFKTNPLSPIVNGFLNTFKLIIGIHCSIIQYAETGNGYNCKDVTGYNGLPADSKGHKQSGDNDICGALPDLPFADLSDITPEVDKTKSSNDIESEEESTNGFEVNLNDLSKVKKI